MVRYVQLSPDISIYLGCARFGEDSVEKMLDWTQENIPKEPAPSILEIGSGNGALLFALHEAGYNAQFICGADYSEDAVNLARAIGISRGEGAERVTFAACDFLQDYPRVTEGMSKPDDGETKVWDLVLDKGTYDAIALAEKDENGRTPADSYPSRIAGVVKPGGHFLIVCAYSYAPSYHMVADISPHSLQFHGG